eukprot:5803697-Pleurochrysis_carterae.AAC.1
MRSGSMRPRRWKRELACLCFEVFGRSELRRTADETRDRICVRYASSALLCDASSAQSCDARGRRSASTHVACSACACACVCVRVCVCVPSLANRGRSTPNKLRVGVDLRGRAWREGFAHESRKRMHGASRRVASPESAS